MSSHREYFSIPNTNLTIDFNDMSNIRSTFIGRSLLVLYPCMICTGVIFNTLIFIIMRRTSHLSTCYYMGILAITDTSVLLFGLLDMWLYLLNKNWSLLSQSTYTCRILTFMPYAISDANEWIVCMMSFDRCIAVTRPLHASSICTVRRAKISVCIVVLCALSINSHFLFTHHLSPEANGCVHYIRYDFFIRRIWVWIDATVYSFLPFIILLTVNLIIIHSLCQIRRSKSTLRVYQLANNQDKNRQLTSMSRKLTIMCLAVTITSLFSSFPVAYLEIYTDIRQEKDSPFIRDYVRPLSVTLQFTNHYVNFFLYALSGKAFRSELKQLFRSVAVTMHLRKNTELTSTKLRLMKNDL